MTNVNWPLYAECVGAIEQAGKGPVLDRVRKLFEDDDDVSPQEERLDVIFIYCCREIDFPDDDEMLAQMYIEFIDGLLGRTEFVNDLTC